jgi:glycosyltransferase involved in cell wall biosynthesis
MNKLRAPDPDRPVLHLVTASSMRGGERQVLLLHQGLLQRSIPSLLVCRTASALAQSNPAGLMSIAWRGPADLPGAVRFLALCRRVAPYLIHCHDGHAFTVGSTVGALLGMPVVMTRRVLIAVNANPFNRWKVSRCRHIVAVSSAVRDALRGICATTPVTTIHDGVMWENNTSNRASLRASFGLHDGAFAIGTVGHFSGEKNLPLVFTLARHLAVCAPHARIVCIGPMAPAAQAESATLPNCIALGEIPNAATYYSAFDGYISTSHREGLGSALLDAVVRDIPSVAIDAGGTRDIFPAESPCLIAAGDESGFLNTVVDLINHIGKYQRIAHVSGLRARSFFSVDHMVTEYLRIYRTIAPDLRKSSLTNAH